jgi:hypothetical protein
MQVAVFSSGMSSSARLGNSESNEHGERSTWELSSPSLGFFGLLTKKSLFVNFDKHLEYQGKRI